jgi:hypothetical protein
MSVEAEVVIDREKVQRIISGFTLPSEIERIETTYRPDHTGDASVFLTFHLKSDVKPSKDDIKRLSRAVSELTGALLNGGIGGFAYTRLEQAA